MFPYLRCSGAVKTVDLFANGKTFTNKGNHFSEHSRPQTMHVNNTIQTILHQSYFYPTAYLQDKIFKKIIELVCQCNHHVSE